MLTDAEKRRNVVLDRVVEEYLRTGKPVKGRWVRIRMKPFDRARVDEALTACVPALLRRWKDTRYPNEIYTPELQGLLQCKPQIAGQVVLFIEGVLRFFNHLMEKDPNVIEYDWPGLHTFLRLDPVTDFQFADAVLRAVGFTFNGTISGGPTPTFKFGLPLDDIEDLLDCREISDLEALRERQQTTRRRVVFPSSLTIPHEPELSMPTPKAFISYSWDDEEHKLWVKELATRLRGDGVETILDQWHVALGDQLPQFMETAVRENDFVIMVCTPGYKYKSDNRQGGSGYEGDIMTAEVLTGVTRRKFVPVLRAGDTRTAIPSWLAGSLRVELDDDPYSEEEYERLLRHLHSEQEQPPPVMPRGAPASGTAPPASAPTFKVRWMGAVVSGSCEMAVAGTCAAPPPAVGPLRNYESDTGLRFNVCQKCVDYLLASKTWTAY